MQSPLLGFNNNVKHRGRLFHIQTEDSGIKHPHVITHLFMDGGRILKTVKTSYAEHVGNGKLSDLVRSLMKEQHKTMFIALRDGQFDYVLDPDDAPPVSSAGVTSTAPDSFQPTPVSLTPVEAGAGLAQTENAAGASMPAGARDASTGTEGTASPMPRPGQRREAPELFTAQTSDAATVDVVSAPSDPPPATPPKKESREKHSSGRYAASRPAAIFASGRNPEAGGSIFGDDLISEKSLDEVILSYLSEDLDTSGTKK